MNRGDVINCRWFVAVMPSSEEESLLWLAGGGVGGTGSLQGSVGSTGSVPSAVLQGSGSSQRTVTIRGGLYTEEMTTQATGATAAAAGAAQASADPAEHDLIDSTADATLLAQFHEDAIKQVNT